MGLLAVGLILFALLMASYSRRSTWLALGSAALSLAALIGLLFLSTAPQSGQIRTALAELAKDLPAGLDQPVTDLATAMDQTAKALSCEGGGRPVCNMLASAPGPATTTPDPAPAHPAPVKADATATFLDTKPADTKPAAKPSSGLPITWLLDEPGAKVASTDSGGFVLSGVNVSDEPLEKVRAVLKPDGDAGRVTLLLQIEGIDGAESAIIPPGAKFTVMAPGRNAVAGGAILSFSYVQGGQRRTSIRYLTPEVVARSAEAPGSQAEPHP